MLADYRSNIPQARDAEVLDLLAVLAARISDSISQEALRTQKSHGELGEGREVLSLKGPWLTIAVHPVHDLGTTLESNENCISSRD